jgi:signal transduction histidine kinase
MFFLMTLKEIRAFYDEERIVQVIHNLLSNAIKFCSEINGKIVISIQDNDDHIAVTIHNNGKASKHRMQKPSLINFINQETKTSKPIEWIRTRYL